MAGSMMNAPGQKVIPASDLEVDEVYAGDGHGNMIPFNDVVQGIPCSLAAIAPAYNNQRG
jgi:hypothetical protein